MKLKEKKFHIQTMNLVLKSECCEKWRSQMALKMLGVCSSHRDQQFLLLNHSISCSYEEVMIKVSKQKSLTFLQNFPIWWCSSCWKLREEKAFKGRRRGAFLSNKHKPNQSCPRVGHMCHTGPEGMLGCVAHGLHTWWPWCFSRAPLTFFSRIWASELRFWIRF